jgi:hypothetical protein
MPPQASDEQLGDALLQSVAYGAFPQDEDVASATVPSRALPKLLEVVGKARENTKVYTHTCDYGTNTDCLSRTKSASSRRKPHLTSMAG